MLGGIFILLKHTLQFGSGGVDGSPSYYPKVPYVPSAEYNLKNNS